jgi:hypothetical protein
MLGGQRRTRRLPGTTAWARRPGRAIGGRLRHNASSNKSRHGRALALAGMQRGSVELGLEGYMRAMARWSP